MPTYSAERQKPVTNVWSINFTRMFVLILERQELALCPFRPSEHQASHTTHRRRTKTHTLAMVLADGLELRFFHILDSCGHFCPSQPSSSS